MTALWGISFDATPISGVVVEFVKTARHFADRGHRVLLDLGYDIKADKDLFFQPYRDEGTLLPDWVELARVAGISDIPGYDQQFVADVLRNVVQRGEPEPRIQPLAHQIADLIVQAWEAQDVSFVLVENGTLPENITYTHALHLAVNEYGARRGLGRFVLWRDHDLMWQSEPSSRKYGDYPYPATPRPPASPHIHYVVLHEEARRRMLDWTPHLAALDVLPNTFSYDRAAVDTSNAGFRKYYGIPEEVPLIARCTRIIQQKRIDRDLHLLAGLTDAYLFVAGDTTESPAEYERLTGLAAELGVADRVIFGGLLAPREGHSAGNRYSVRDLLAHTTVMSFLTSYDYESYGNPIGEAIASGVPYLTTRYQLYDTVYGGKGFRAAVFDPADGDLPGPGFIQEVRDLLDDEEKRADMAEFNYQLGQRHTTKDVLERLLLTPMDERIRLSVILPVYNEAANLPAVLDSLYHQRGIDRELYEIVLVDNNSTDNTVAIAQAFATEHPDVTLHVVLEPEQGVSCARRTGMRFASVRSRGRSNGDERFHLVSADADCRVAPDWLAELFAAMESGKAAIGVCDYYYSPEHFTGRPRLWDAIWKTLRCRAVTFALFGTFPDGKGFAVDRDVHDAVGGIEIFYQVQDGRFVNHLSDDWDFGIKVRASGEDIAFAPRSRVEINPRRVDHAINEVITGRAYGNDGIIVMQDIRVTGAAEHPDLTEEQAQQAWEFSIKDFTPKNTILPVLLTPSLLDDDVVIEFFGPELAERLARRIAKIKDEMRVLDFTPIHSYKTPSYRLYFEFREEIFARLRATVGEDIGYPPPLPQCLQDVPPERFTEFVRYYCEDRESGEAHNYFGNGGVF
ncbi:glycosyltransferase involved in cell wall biosynthesis [Kibdelosporangium banguiense]|uniref:Glycosyltransferase involved in cell wall biosynthesis n=1 Tax=Kibdelosporangium banguiense TaxID=1365924 RepID=A0ABS4TVM0_9PSEU|nr:glycosyltransferase [Kibdelosporangium banguiense]MBP2327971.1 glycosyltransferase involved in cell wall biosynthesis [Kibdelosporangium banguiense]